MGELILIRYGHADHLVNDLTGGWAFLFYDIKNRVEESSMVKHKVSTKWDRFKQKWLATCIGKCLRNIWSYAGWDDGFALVLLAIGGLGYAGGLIPSLPEWGEFYIDIRSELIGIGFSVLLIANAGEWILRKQEKKRLILQMGSPDNAFAREAVRQLRARGWLRDGSLIGVNLSYADLSGVDLWAANLNRVDLWAANLSGANLWVANLSGAYPIRANLSGAYMVSANLSGAYLIRANLFGANLFGANLSGAEYTKETIWPEGFDPIAAGAVLVE